MTYQRDPGEYEWENRPLIMAVGKLARVVNSADDLAVLEPAEARAVLELLLRYPMAQQVLKQ